MLRRLILALLIACLAFPAAAMPMLHAGLGHRGAVHQAMAMPAHHHAMSTAPRGGSLHDDDMSGQMHECIGCMARYDGVVLPQAPLVPVERARCSVAPTPIARTGPGPETPPPRC